MSQWEVRQRMEPVTYPLLFFVLPPAPKVRHKDCVFKHFQGENSDLP